MDSQGGGSSPGQDSGAAPANAPQDPGPSIWKGRGVPVFWIALVLIAVSMQWPMLKGWYYRSTGAVPASSGPAWHTDFDEASEEARRSGRLLLVDFSADWCPPCVTMKHEVWPDPDVRRLVEASFVPVLIDADRDEVLSTRYRVWGIPTILVLEADGTLVARGGYLPASGMRRFLKEHAR